MALCRLLSVFIIIFDLIITIYLWGHMTWSSLKRWSNWNIEKRNNALSVTQQTGGNASIRTKLSLTPSIEGTAESMEPFIRISPQPTCQQTTYELLSSLPRAGGIFINLILRTATSLDYSSGFSPSPWQFTLPGYQWNITERISAFVFNFHFLDIWSWSKHLTYSFSFCICRMEIVFAWCNRFWT